MMVTCYAGQASPRFGGLSVLVDVSFPTLVVAETILGEAKPLSEGDQEGELNL